MASNIRVTELDFDQIKENLKTFLRSQNQFTDYDFDASNLSVLVDLLAYNTHYNAVLANLVSNEMFIDTALKRSSVVSLAKQLNYTPRTITSARALVDIQLQNVTGSPNYISLPKYTAFNWQNTDGATYTFYNTKSYTTIPDAGTYTFSGVELVQGRVQQYQWTVGSPGPAEKYTIPNLNVDTTTLQVTVQYTGTSSFSEVYQQNTNIVQLDGTSKAFFLQENTEGLAEIYFGDDVIGKKLSTGDTVKVLYLISDGAAANVSQNVNITWNCNSIAGEISGDRVISTTSKPNGGADAETIDDIRFHAINTYAAQNRAVTKYDYATIIKQNLQGAESVNVWGGEDNVPPVYGKTFISIKPKTGFVLTEAEKTRIIEQVLKPRSIVTAQHEFVDPDYTYLKFDVTVRYSTALSNMSTSEVSALVKQKITDFMNTNLSRFNATFYKSQLDEQIMNLDESIISVNTQVTLQKRLPLIPNVRFTQVDGFKLPAPIHPAQIYTSYIQFSDPTGVRDSIVRDTPDQSPPDYNGTGTLKLFDIGTGVVLQDRVGFVDYKTGVVTLNSQAPLTIAGYLGDATTIMAYAGIQEGITDITPAFNEILVLDDNVADPVSFISNGINIDVIPVNS